MAELVRVACVLSAKKCRHLDFERLVDDGTNMACMTVPQQLGPLIAYVSRHGLRLQTVSLSSSLDEQGTFDVVLHKLTDTIARANDGCQDAQRELQQLQAYRSQHPDVVMIDNLASVGILLDRGLTYSLAASVAHKQPGTGLACKQIDECGRLHTPPFCVVADVEAAVTALSPKSPTQLHYPVLCKSIVAHGSTKAHHMAIVFVPAGLQEVAFPCVLQQFINHDAVVFKIFVIGDDISVVKRPSIRNLDATESKTIFFDSHKVSKADSASHLNKAGAHHGSHAHFDLDSLRSSVQQLRKHLDLDLFGIDVVVSCHDGEAYIVDINYFPGYNGVAGFHTSLLSLLARRSAEQDAQQDTPAVVAPVVQSS